MAFVLDLSPSSVLFWLLTLAWLAEPMLRAGRPRSRAGRREVRLLMAAILGAVSATALLHHLGLGNLEGETAVIVRRLGLLLYGGGIVLRHWAAAALGPWFTRDVEVSPSQRLVSRGPYRWLRHPLYVGLLFAAVGLCLLFANLPGAGLAVTLVGSAIQRRIHREEILLEQCLGSFYRDWRALRI